MLWGCGRTTSGTRIFVDTIQGKQGVEEYNVTLARTIAVERVIYRQVGGLVEAQVDLVNRSAKSEIIEIKGKWYDKEGFEVEDPKELWREVIFSGKERKAVKFVAPGPQAVKLEVLARPGRFEE